MVQNKWKEFAIRQVLSGWNSKVDSIALYDWIEQTEDKDLKQLFDDYEVIVYQQFDNLELYDVASQISELAAGVQRIQDQEKPTVVSKPEIISVTLSNGDVALFVNSDAVLQLDAQDAGQNPAEVGKYLAEALGVELQEINMDVPTDEDWNWNDVYELLPPAEKLSDSGADAASRMCDRLLNSEEHAVDDAVPGVAYDAAELIQRLSTSRKSTQIALSPFVSSVATLLIWGYDKNDGTPYEECDEPSEGYVDSHCCLMQLIEAARNIK
jgi:hypothetical protein